MSFTALRQALSNETIPYPWEAMLRILKNWETPEELPLAVEYVRTHTATWPVDACLLMNREAMLDHPAFSLAKHLLLLHCSSLEEMHSYLDRLSRLERLEALTINFNFSPEDVSLALQQRLCQANDLPMLRNFSFSAMSNERVLVDSLLKASWLQEVEELDLGGQWLSLQTMEILGNPTRFPRLHSLTLDAVNVEHMGWKALWEGKRKDNLRSLDVSDLDVEEAEEFQYFLSEGHDFPCLKTLLLRGIQLSDDGLLELLKNNQMPSLRILDVSNNQLTFRRLYNVSRLSEYPLKELYLSHNPLKDAGVRQLAQQPFCRELESLELSNVGMTESGLSGLLEGQEFTTLEELELQGNRLSGECLFQLLSSPAFPALKSISFSGTYVSVEHIEALEKDERVKVY